MTARSASLRRAFACLTAVALWLVAGTALGNSYVQIRVEGVINPVKERYVAAGIERAVAEHASFLVISIDTPGGLVSSLQKIATLITNAPMPVIGWVEPSSAQATSAGAFILLATDVAAMAPGTRVGAAHPIGGEKALDGVLDTKATNSLSSFARSLAERHGRPQATAESMVRDSKSFTDKEALAAQLVEVSAANTAELLRALDGRELKRGRGSVTLHTQGATRIELPMSRASKLLDAFADPTLASLLLSLGVMGILYEFASPGIGLAGLSGLICLLLGLLSLSVLPLELGGLLLSLVGILAVALEIKVPSHGLLVLGGVIAIVLGGLFLVDTDQYFGAVPHFDWRLAGPFVAGAALLLALLARSTRRALAAPPALGDGALIGKRGRVSRAFVAGGEGFDGSVFVDGARWRAIADNPLGQGAEIQVVGVLRNPLRLAVRPSEPGAS